MADSVVHASGTGIGLAPAATEMIGNPHVERAGRFRVGTQIVHLGERQLADLGDRDNNAPASASTTFPTSCALGLASQPVDLVDPNQDLNAAGTRVPPCRTWLN